MARDRKDPKGRYLKDGESYDPNKKIYRYQYHDVNNIRRSLYSVRLTRNDSLPAGYDNTSPTAKPLRDREREIQDDIANGLDTKGGNMTVYELARQYTDLKWKDVRETTHNGYRTALKFLASDPMGKRKINKINATEAEKWIQDLHDKEGKGYSTLHTLRGILRPAFAMAKRNRWVIDNPFDFPMNKKRYGGTKTRDAVSKKDMRRFLDFLRTDRHFCRYFNGVYILFNTGLRISEFCGLTIDDIDFDNHVIKVERQLIRLHDGEKDIYYIEEPKTANGRRQIPMLPDVETIFKEVIANRPKLDHEPVVYSQDKKMKASGFLWFDKDQNLEVAQHWQNHFRWALKKFNKTFKDELPDITPHVCRHTFCSNCAGAGMNPKTLQMIMGHASIQVTMDVYTQLEPGDIKQEFFDIAQNKNYDVYPLSRKPETVSPYTEDDDEEEPDVDLSEIPDDDEE